MSRAWQKSLPKTLGCFVDPNYAVLFRLPFVRRDVLAAPAGQLRVARAVYDAMTARGISYAPEKYDPDQAQQVIRTAHEVLEAPAEGTCLDLAALYAGVCIGNDLLPVVVVTASHAYVLISTGHVRSQWDARDRAEYRRHFDGEPVTDLAVVRELVDSGAYVAVECTGMAAARSLPDAVPEGRGRVDGLMSFDRALAAGAEQLTRTDDPLRFAFDVATAHYAWGVAPTSQLAGGTIVELGCSRFGASIELVPGDLAAPVRGAPAVPEPVGIGTGPELVDRDEVREQLRSAVGPGRLAGLYGVPGSGKTALVRDLASAGTRDRFPGGIVYLRAAGDSADDVLQVIYRSFYPDAADKPSAAEVGRALAGVTALILLDDVEFGADDLEELRAAAPQCGFVVAAATRAPLREGRAFRVEGLEPQYAAALVERHMERPLDAAEAAHARRLGELVDGLPARIVLAAGCARDEGEPLARIVAALEAGAVDEALRSNVRTGEGEAAILAVLAAADAPLGVEHLEAMAGAEFDDALDRLLACGLVEAHSPRYGLTWAGRELVPPLPGEGEVRPVMLRRLAGWAAEAAADEVVAERRAIVSLLSWAEDRPEDAAAAVRLATAAQRPLAASGRWDAWARVLSSAQAAAATLGDRSAEAWALHQLGVRAAGLGDTGAGRTLLGRAERIRKRLGETDAAAHSRAQLAALGGGPPGPVSRALRWVREHWAPLAGAAVLAGAAAGGAVALMDDGPPPTTAPPAAGVVTVAGDPAFGEVQVGRDAIRQFTVSAEDGPVRVEGVSGSGDVDVFGVSSSCAGVLEPGQACPLEVVFAPQGPGTFAADVTVEWPGGPTVLRVTGSAFTGGDVVVAGEGDFGDVVVGSSSEPRRFRLANEGDRPVAVTAIAVTDPAAFPVDGASGCLVELQPGATCDVRVSFTPRMAGVAEARLEVDSAAGSARLDLIGRGLRGPVLELTDAAFGEVAEAPAATTVAVRNAGDAPLTVTGIELDERARFAFTLRDARTCLGELAPGAACEFSVSFSPPEPGTWEGTLAAEGDGQRVSRPVSARLLIPGFAAARLVPPDDLDGRLDNRGIATIDDVRKLGGGALLEELAPDDPDRLEPLFGSPPEVDFGFVFPGGPPTAFRMLVLVVSGELPVTVDEVRATGSGIFDLVTDCARRTLGPGDFCRILIGFDPVTFTDEFEALVVSYSAGTGIERITLMGAMGIP